MQDRKDCNMSLETRLVVESIKQNTITSIVLIRKMKHTTSLEETLELSITFT